MFLDDEKQSVMIEGEKRLHIFIWEATRRRRDDVQNAPACFYLMLPVI